MKKFRPWKKFSASEPKGVQPMSSFQHGRDKGAKGNKKNKTKTSSTGKKMTGEKTNSWLEANRAKKYLGETTKTSSTWFSRLNQYLVLVACLILVTLLWLSVSLFSITIFQHDQYKTRAESNPLRRYPIAANRGVIYDQKGNLLVRNEPSYDLYVDIEQFAHQDLEQLLKDYPKISKKDQNQLSQELDEIKANQYLGNRALFIHNIPADYALQIQAFQKEGLFVEESSYRYYPYESVVGHVLGYIGPVTQEDLSEDSPIDLNDMVGREGLEAYYDGILRGEKGYKLVEVDSHNNILSEYAYDNQAPKSGGNLVVSLRVSDQRKMQSILQSYVNGYHAKSGAAVIMDINSGQVRVLASYPNYDNNLFIGGISYKKYKKLSKSPQTPLLNKAIAAQEPAGSTFKTIVASAALQEGAITPGTVFVSSGVIRLSGGTPFQEYHKHVYGSLALRDGLMVSSNIYFCRTMLRLGIEKFDRHASKFGIGEYTGIDLPGEAKGRLPSPKNKIWLAKNGAYWLEPIWYPEGDSCNSAIGQGITLVTPVQLASAAATIANGGNVLQPRIVKTIIKDGQEQNLEPVIKYENIIADRHLQVVREGMRMSVVGSRRIIPQLADVPVAVAAKTGTAEFGTKDKDGYSQTHAWVMGFFPYDNPRFAFAVLLEGGGASSRAAEVMRDWMKRSL